MEQIFDGIALGPLLQRGFGNLLGIAIEDDLAAEAPGIGADIYQVIGSSHDLLIVLHHDHGIAQRLEFFEHVDETICISGVQTYGGLIEDIEGAYERASKGGTEVDALAFTARKRVRETVEREVAKSHIQKEL